MKQVTLEAKPRTDIGRAAAKRLRQAGQLPAVIYGESGTEHLLLDTHAFEMAYRKLVGTAALITLKIEGHENDMFAVLQEAQRNSINDDFIHLDFREIQRGKPMEAAVPVHSKGTPTGVKNQGGILDLTLDTISIRCRPRDLPEFIEVDVTGLSIGDSIHVRDIAAPEGVTFLNDEDEVVAACVGTNAAAPVEPSEEEEEEAEPAEA
ncbi:MAG: large subunit ribosomal protein L25 [Puniceicoccaceae bacterium 5H]|nr:MAG: large subunit ribosomal protein L25 [Puniceicoccaceae bacterium 5H]